MTAEQVTTLESTIAISIEGDPAFVDDARVTMTDIATSNGVIHVHRRGTHASGGVIQRMSV